MKILFLIISFLSINLASSHNINCDCAFSDLTFAHFSRQRTCTVKYDLNIKNDNTTITTINNYYNNGYPNIDVKMFLVQFKTIYYMPKGLDVVFPTLNGLRFEYTKMKHITKSNLQPFPELKLFISTGNEIQFIEKDLFKYNTKLEYVSLRLNKITYIDPFAFDVIKGSLVQLWIDGTAIACGLSYAANSAAVSRVIDSLKNSACANIENAPALYTYWLKSQDGGTSDNCDANLEKCEENIDNLSTVISELIAYMMQNNCKVPGSFGSFLNQVKLNIKI